MPEASRVADHIVSILQESPNKSLLGSKLSVLLKSRCADFDPLAYEVRTLREFIRANVSQVYESSRQGLDVVYTLSPVQTTPEQRPLPVIAEQRSDLKNVEEARRLDDELWKTYVSPSGPYRLFVNRESNEFRVVGLREESPLSPWVQVPPCSAARHKKIAEDFVASLPAGEAKTSLAPLIAEKVWWIPFFEKTRNLDIEKQWLDFRRSALLDELRKTLSSLGIEPANLSDLKQQGVTSKRYIPRDSTVRAQRDVGRLRSVALAIVGRVSESELRELRFRLGDVLDALSNK